MIVRGTRGRRRTPHRPTLDPGPILSEVAYASGAVNTVILHDGRKIGENTDWSGFAEPFRRKMSDVALEFVGRT